MAEPNSALARVSETMDLQRARAEIAWIPERGLRELERREPSVAWSLSFFFGGGGQIYVGEHIPGLALMALAAVGVFVIPAFLPGWLGTLLWLGTGLASSTFALRRARAINRYIRAREQLEQAGTNVPGAYRLLAAKTAAEIGIDPASAMQSLRHAPVAPTTSKHQAALDQLRKLALLHAQNALNDTEYRERKQDTLSEIPIPTRNDLDDLLFELLPLRDDGMLTQEDLEFVKALGART